MNESTTATESTPFRYWGYHQLVVLAICVAALHFARDVFMPIVGAVLISFLLAPVVRCLERWRLPHTAAVLTTVAVTIALVVALITFAGWQFLSLADQLPKYEQTFKSRIESLRNNSPASLKRAVDILQGIGDDAFFSAPLGSAGGGQEEDPAVPVEMRNKQPTLVEMVQTYVTPTLGRLVQLGLVGILVIFILLFRRDLRDRLVHLAGQSNTRLTGEAINAAAGRVSGYLLMQLVNNACYGLLVGSGLWLIGVPGAVLWGLGAMLVRFIPYVGPWTGALLPIFFSLGVFGDWVRPCLVVGMFVSLEILFNNFVEPYLFGAGAGISPLGVLVSLLFWGWIWGGIGLLVAVPLTACLVVAGHYLPQLQLFTILIGDGDGDRPQSIATADTRHVQQPHAAASTQKEEYVHNH